MSLLIPLLLAFTVQSTPSRHLNFRTADGDITKPKVYVYDPYATGAAAGVPNATGLNVTCSSSQGIGFNDTGSALSLVCIDAATSAVTPTPPTAPSGGSATAFNYVVDSGFPAFPSTIDSAWGIGMPNGVFSIFSHLSTIVNLEVTCGAPQSWSGTTLVGYFSAGAPSTAGSAGAVAWSNASFLGRQKQISFTSSAALNSTTSVANNSGGFQNAWRGNTAGAGGFLFWSRIALTDTKAASRFAVGLFNSGTALDLSVEPSTFTNAVFFGCSSGDTNLNICTNDNSGAATCATLGASYPCNTDGATYDFWISTAPNSTGISYAIERLDSAASTGAMLTSDLPQNTVQLNWKSGIGTGPTTSTAVIMRWFGTCLAANF